MKTRHLALFFIVAFSTGLLVRFPAGWALHFARDALPPGVVVASASGSLTRARLTNVAVAMPDGPAVHIESLLLDLAWLPLLRGCLRTDWTASAYGGVLQGRATVQGDAWRLENVRGEMDASVMQVVAPAFSLLGSEGRIKVDIETVFGDHNGQDLGAAGNITLEQLQLAAVAPGHTLGSYDARFDTDDQGRVAAAVHTVGEAPLLELEAELDISTSRMLMKGHAGVVPRAPREVRDLLALLGPASHDRARIDWRFVF